MPQPVVHETLLSAGKIIRGLAVSVKKEKPPSLDGFFATMCGNLLCKYDCSLGISYSAKCSADVFSVKSAKVRSAQEM